jgi:hypothetical protein
VSIPFIMNTPECIVRQKIFSERQKMNSFSFFTKYLHLQIML